MAATTVNVWRYGRVLDITLHTDYKVDACQVCGTGGVNVRTATQVESV